MESNSKDTSPIQAGHEQYCPMNRDLTKLRAGKRSGHLLIPTAEPQYCWDKPSVDLWEPTWCNSFWSPLCEFWT